MLMRTAVWGGLYIEVFPSGQRRRSNSSKGNDSRVRSREYDTMTYYRAQP
jgi:hypothetical protein